MALFRKGILSAFADSIAMSAQISAAKEKQSLLLTTAETMKSVGEISRDESFTDGIKVSVKLAETIKIINKML